MVTYSDKVKELIDRLYAGDPANTMGTVMYLAPLAEENDTYPAGEGINLAASCGGAEAVIDRMAMEGSDPTLEVWLLGGTPEEASEIVRDATERFAPDSCYVHAFDHALWDAIEATGAELTDENAEYIGKSGAWARSEDVSRITPEEAKVLSGSDDEDIALYLGDILTGSGSCEGFAVRAEEQLLSACTVETDDTLWGRTVEPIWVYTAPEQRGRGLAAKCVGHALSETAAGATVLYHTDTENAASAALAKALGLAVNNICRTYLIKL